MSLGEEDARRNEIVIVRRRSSDGEGGHHGGVWKIAYADFMTAMMAFFLVMWLVSAASRDTRSQVASYFNPLRLADSITTAKGLKELQPGEKSRAALMGNTPNGIKEKDESRTKSKVGVTGTKGGETDDAEPKVSPEELFSDPYGVLAKLAARATATNNGPAQEKGKAFRDPFDPGFQRPREPAPKPPAEAAANKAGKHAAPVASPPAKEAPAEKPSWEPKIVKAGEEPDAKKPEVGDRPSPKSSREGVGPDTTPGAVAQKAAAAEELSKALGAAAVRLGGDKGPNVEVSVVSEGVLISLTDKADFSMFDTGSVVPRPDVVAMIEGLAKVIATRRGNIVISGHTDARPFRSGTYDNWRLSTDRAHVAYHMLVRGGVEPERIERVEGHAARRLKLPADGTAAVNRRVEILVRPESKP